MSAAYRTYSVQRAAREPLVRFISEALESAGCRIANDPDASSAPFLFEVVDPRGNLTRILAYAFYANMKLTKNRPSDEYRFQIKYGSDTKGLHRIWQDSSGDIVTVLCGLSPEQGFFVGADPILHSPTQFFISLEFKERHVRDALVNGWTHWERQKTYHGFDSPVEVLVAAEAERFYDYVLFERAALGFDQGHRGLLAETFGRFRLSQVTQVADPSKRVEVCEHPLLEELGLTDFELSDLIQSAPRLHTAVRGWTAEVHLLRQLEKIPGVTECIRIEEDGKPDLSVRYRDRAPVLIECKNVLSKPYADGTACVDFQKTRASKGDPCSRYYQKGAFEILAASLHPISRCWDFRFASTIDLAEHSKCRDRLSNRVRVDNRFGNDPISLFESLSRNH